MSFINLRSSSYGRRASTNSVEQTMIHKRIGVNLIAAAPLSPLGASLVKEDAAVYGSFLREALIHLNTRIRPAQD